MARPDIAAPKVLRSLAREPLTISQIAERTGLARAVVVSALERLGAQVRCEREVGLSPGKDRGRANLWCKVEG